MKNFILLLFSLGNAKTKIKFLKCIEIVKKAVKICQNRIFMVSSILQYCVTS